VGHNMPWIDRVLLVVLGVGVWTLLGLYTLKPQPAESQDIYFEVQKALNNCGIIGRVQEDFYGVHRLDANVDCGPSWIGEQ